MYESNKQFLLKIFVFIKKIRNLFFALFAYGINDFIKKNTILEVSKDSSFKDT